MSFSVPSCTHGAPRLLQGSQDYKDISKFCVETESTDPTLEWDVLSLDQYQRFCYKNENMINMHIVRMLYSMTVDAFLAGQKLNAFHMFYKRAVLLRLCIKYGNQVFWTIPNGVDEWMNEMKAIPKQMDSIIQVLDANVPCNCLYQFLQKDQLSSKSSSSLRDNSIISLTHFMNLPLVPYHQIEDFQIPNVFHIELRVIENKQKNTVNKKITTVAENSSVQQNTQVYLCLIALPEAQQLIHWFPIQANSTSLGYSLLWAILSQLFQELTTTKKNWLRPEKITVQDPVLCHVLQQHLVGGNTNVELVNHKEYIIETRNQFQVKEKQVLGDAMNHLCVKNHKDILTNFQSRLQAKSSNGSNDTITPKKNSHQWNFEAKSINSIVLLCCLPSCSSFQQAQVIKRCSACKKSFYCSKKCQKLHWFLCHKQVCTHVNKKNIQKSSTQSS